MTYKNKSLLKEKSFNKLCHFPQRFWKEKFNTEVIIFILSLILLFTTPLILASADYGEGAYGSGIYGQASCRDNVCDASESCSSCSDDCGKCVVSESGGGRIFAEKPYIEKIHQWNIITSEEIALMEGFDENFGIKNIEIEVNNEEDNAKLIVRKYHSKPNNLSEAPGIVYKYLEINSENLKFLKRLTISTKIEKI